MTIGSLFSGIEGFGEGLKGIGTVIWCAEIDKYASAIHEYHYPECVNYGDARRIIPEQLPDTGIITFGWPCQDNSIAGKRAGHRKGTRSSLLDEAVRIIRIKKPKYFIAENVPGLFSVNGGYDFYKAIRLFTDSGYDCQWQVLNTRWFLPQNRERIYFVGHIRGEGRPEVFPIGESNGDAGEGGKQSENRVLNAIDSNYYKGADGKRPLLQIGYIKDNAEAHRVYDSEGISRTIKNGGGMGAKTGLYCVPVLTPDRAEKRQNGRRFKEDGDPSFTLTGQDIHGVMITHTNKSGTMTDHDEAMALRAGASHNYQTVNRIRRLTPVECERLQGFPDYWTKYGMFDGEVKEISDSQRYKTIGNAVSVPVVKAIGDKLMEFINQEDT